MQTSRTKVNAELLGIDQALHRAAATAKKQAEQLGMPYVIYRESDTGKILNSSSQIKSKPR